MATSDKLNARQRNSDNFVSSDVGPGVRTTTIARIPAGRDFPVLPGLSVGAIVPMNQSVAFGEIFEFTSRP
jgi:hypothetical protein